MNVLVTGAKGFIGKNLVVLLRNRHDTEVFEHDVESPSGSLEEYLAQTDVVYHLAGVNRPEWVEDFEPGNVGLTEKVCEVLRRLGRKPVLVLSSSTQALLDNPYGQSKRQAEELVLEFGKKTGAKVFVFRLPGVFGKWCRPNYNSVVATFCHNIAHDLPISISNPANALQLVYVGHVCAAFLKAVSLGQAPLADMKPSSGNGYVEVAPVFHTTLGELADTIRSFRSSRSSLQVPAFDDPFIYCLYATYLSYLEGPDFAYPLGQKTDNRGSLAEFLKSPAFGQIFVSRTKPGITRGDHYHHTKTEKFLVVQGDAIIRFRHILGDEIIEHPVSGQEFKVVDIPPGYSHSIENVGNDELVTLFWADRVFDPENQDTVYEKVMRGNA
jgi:UDP-2-acetamido-2,6-beta-L-arabino-hexul-4-ose reductase